MILRTVPVCRYVKRLFLRHNVYYQNNINFRTYLDNIDKLPLKQFPNKESLCHTYRRIKVHEKICENSLLKELIQECGINHSVTPLQGLEAFIITVDINILKRFDIIKNENEVMENLLSQLGPFPFDERKISSQDKVTIKILKQSIEKQYLAWSFKVDLELINVIYKKLNSCLLYYCSLKGMLKAMTRLRYMQRTRNATIVTKIFFLQIEPLLLKSLYSFENNLLGMNWDHVVVNSPLLMKNSYNCIMLLLNILQSKNFSKNQILTALPYIRVNLYHFLRRLDFLLNEEELSQHRNHSEFLKLVLFSDTYLERLVHGSRMKFEGLLMMCSVNSHSVFRKLTTDKITYQLMKHSLFSNEVEETLKRHPKYLSSSMMTMEDTIKYLKSQSFTGEEIKESITIVLYSASLINKTLKQIKTDKTLQELGFVNGCLPEETTLFSKGTVLRRKTLQLCLYFMEKEYDFSGEGILFSE